MILTNRIQNSKFKIQNIKRKRSVFYLTNRFPKVLFLAFYITLFTSCGVYTFNDVSIDYSKLKTVKIMLFENKANYKNATLASRLTDALQQKIANLTKLTRTNSDDANIIIQGTITRYDVSTSGISNNQTATNRLTVGAHIIYSNTVDNKIDEFDISRDFDFAASLTLQQAENQLADDIVNNVRDEVFNHIFSGW